MLSKRNASKEMLLAKKMVLEAIPHSKVLRGLDYKDLFVFVVEPETLGLIAVRKLDGKVLGFNPIINDPDSYFKAVDKNMVDLE